MILVALGAAPKSFLRPISFIHKSAHASGHFSVRRLSRHALKGLVHKRHSPAHTRHYATKTNSSSDSDEELFTYTSRCFLYNEKRRLAERYVPFNVSALKQAAAASVGRRDVIRIQKLAEGGFNRVFLLEMGDESEIIAKIPYHKTVPKRFTTESEVATMDFLSSHGVPVPRVYAWSSDASNAVGSEYVIMQKAPGQPLQSRWFELTPKERVHLVTSFVEIEKKSFNYAFGAYGSIYFKDNLPLHLQADLYAPDTLDDNGDGRRFCIGPTVDYMFWYRKRAELDLNRGPCKSLRSLLCVACS